ncbi:hypothetical protein CEY16_01130 [Halalkalibacillus sediminis]|uniref:TNase-like domain-containing protein n=2 Tax=Halalkalibacillus sediminis TaxID=2018042 RepID=A0A2I0QYE7_9BACI|nr:hypothetical protein CEY16_01130 [Halalkalibacillus sediminis]
MIGVFGEPVEDELSDSEDTEEIEDEETASNQGDLESDSRDEPEEEAETNSSEDDNKEKDDTGSDEPDKNTEEQDPSKNKEESSDDTEQSNNDVNKSEETSDQSTDSDKSNGPTDSVAATVTRVVDGDTIEIQINGQEEQVRLLLVDTPETKHPSLPVQPFGPEASEFAKQKLSGKDIQLEYDGPKRDKYDRLLGYIWVDGQMFNEMLLAEGLARLAYVYDPPYTHYNAYVKAQTKAMNAGKGIWSIEGYVQEDGFNHEGENSSNSDSGASESTTSNSNSSNNTSSNGNLKYDPDGPDRDCGDFDTHQEAQDFYIAAGGPDKDPHRLDRENDGLACESLP